jgi:MoxR-like ATPase
MMRDMARYTFRADLSRPSDPHLDSPKKQEPYVASDELIDVVNKAIKYERPLLLEGETGCGKTRLAWAVAYELGLPLYTWHVRSTSKVQDGLYEYDHLLRLHDVQLYRLEAQQGSTVILSRANLPAGRDPADPKQYYRPGPLGKAFKSEDRPAVVLIDEIDKADMDFPNDLLDVLDVPWEIHVPEADDVIAARNTPIVFITSNNANNTMPHPFLRRCYYYFLEFPTVERLKQIIDAHNTVDGSSMPPDLPEQAIASFFSVRDDDRLEKKPGTSEFLDWFRVLRNDQQALAQLASWQAGGTLPHSEVLIKTRYDWRLYRSAP